MKVNLDIYTNTYQEENKKANLNVNKTSDFVIPTKTEKSPIDFTIEEYKNMKNSDIDKLYPDFSTSNLQAKELLLVATCSGDENFKKDTFDLIKEDFKNKPNLKTSPISEVLREMIGIMGFLEVAKKEYLNNLTNVSYKKSEENVQLSRKYLDEHKLEFTLNFNNIVKLSKKLKENFNSRSIESKIYYKMDKIDEKINSYLERYQEKLKEKKQIIKQF